MDKLAQRYNAQEMIRANSQAETAQMEGLQEQVEAYEAVLQEMRKLNYKNTELTEKMYSLVDESIEKVRTLKIEASENGANTEQISKEMSDAVTGTLNEALNNMDATVAKTISESLAAALAEPTEDIKLSALATEDVKEALKLMDVKVDSITESQNAIQSKLENFSVSVDGPTISDDQINTFTASVEGVSEQVISLASSVGSIDEKISNIEYTVGSVDEKIAALTSSVEAASEKIDALTNSASEETVDAQEDVSKEIVETPVVDNSAVIAETVTAMAGELTTSINNINEKTSEVDTYVKGIWETVEAQKNNMQALLEKPNAGHESEELRAAVVEIANSVEEIRTGVRNVKSAQDESKDTIKTSLDSAIYGLKQDNREIVEFVQRMNTNLMASVNDPDKDKKEEEALAREEEKKKELEERFKATEDFVHKESVKVYRNVQAVVNEKMDRHSDSMDSGNKQLAAQVAQVKTIAVIAALLSAIDIVINVLKIFGVI